MDEACTGGSPCPSRGHSRRGVLVALGATAMNLGCARGNLALARFQGWPADGGDGEATGGWTKGQQEDGESTVAPGRNSQQRPARKHLTRPYRVGTTFSQLQCAYLGLDYRETFEQICSLGCDVIRLCGYWDEIEAVKGRFDFAVLDGLLETAATYQIPMVLTVGMKAPRWPEFHFPAWVRDTYAVDDAQQPLDAIPGLAERALTFTRAVVEHAKDAPGLSYWQIENEPFHAFEVNGGRFLSAAFVRQEAELVRETCHAGQQILVTSGINLWPPEGVPGDDDALAQAVMIGDAVGINVYASVPDGSGDYLHPSPAYWSKLHDWRPLIEAANREAWISELQAEPWEYDAWEIVRDLETTPSASPETTTGLMERAADLGYSTVMLWGCEYWVYRTLQGDRRWWNAVRSIIGSAA